MNITQEEFNKIEKEFLQHLNNYFEEINDSILQLRKNKGNPLVRSQLCLAFIGADTFSRFYRIFKGERDEVKLDEDNEGRFKDWLNTFVFTKNNEVYTKNREVIKCDTGIVWRLRNSFLHFYSFPKQKETENRILFFFNVPRPEHQKIEKGFKDRGYKVIFIDVYYLISALLEGFLVQIKDMIRMIKEQPEEYIEAVLFTHQITMRESASTVLIKKPKS